MDRVFSTRLDEQVIALLDEAARQTGASKKSLLERAIRIVAKEHAAHSAGSVFTGTSGAWAERKQDAGATLEHARAAFRQSMLRRQR